LKVITHCPGWHTGQSEKQIFSRRQQSKNSLDRINRIYKILSRFPDETEKMPQ